MERQVCVAAVFGADCLAVAALSSERVLLGSTVGLVRVWSVTTQRYHATLHGHEDGVTVVAALSDTMAVTGSQDASIRVWDVAAQVCLATLSGHLGFVYAIAVLSPTCVVSGGSDKTLRIWDLAAGACAATLRRYHSQSVHAVAASASSGRLVSAGGPNELIAWTSELRALHAAGARVGAPPDRHHGG